MQRSTPFARKSREEIFSCEARLTEINAFELDGYVAVAECSDN
jgi:hypothetical protein